MKITKLSIIIATAILLVFSCRSSKEQQYKRLSSVDSLLESNMLDSAQSIMHQIENKGIEDDNAKAYYDLLSTRIAYMQYKSNIPLKPLNRSIVYYQAIGDKENIAQALFYKGVILYDMGKHKEAIATIKNSESIAITLENDAIKNKIFKFLSVVNAEIGEYQKEITYAKKSLAITNKYHNIVDKVDAYNRLAVAYYHLNNKDSTRYYINKCIPFVHLLMDKEKIICYDNIGFFNMDTNPKMAFKYLNEAMKIGPSPDTYDNLARLYIKVGEKQKADSLWEKALQTKDILKKSQIVEAMLKYKQQEGDYAKVTELATRLLALKDSISAQRQEERLKEMQMDFDNQVGQTMHEKKEEKMKFTILSLFLILIVIALLTSIQRIKTQNALLEKENELLEKQGLLQQYHNYILQMEKNDKADKNEINRLKNKVEKLQRSIDGRSYQGNLLYSIVQQGKSIRNWNKSELQEFLNYYISVDLNYSLSLEEYRDLTARQKVFLILKHEGKSDNKIAEMLGLNNAALRTMKSRIHKIWKEPSE